MGVGLVWLGVAGAFLLGVASAGIAVRMGPRLGLVDLPDNDLKTHAGRPVPLGGAVLMVAVHVGLAVADAFDPGLLVATSIVFVMGLVDDIRGLPPLIRLAVTVAAGATLVLITGLVEGAVAGTTAVLLVVVAVNAVNLFDGLDALASSVGALSAVALSVFAFSLGVEAPWLPVILAAALGGVLVFNWPPARLYLGDNGAYVLGLTLAWAALRTSTDWPSGLLSAALIGVPLIDLGVTVVRRLKTGHPLFAGDRDHTYDRLNRRFSFLSGVALAMVAAQLVWTGLALGMYSVGGVGVALGAVVVFGVGALAAGWVTA